MELELGWLLLAIPFVFGLGWVACRLDWRQWKIEQRDAPQAYFKGLHFLLNEQQDEAIDAFVQAIQHDPNTTDLHFALGSLFRRRGEYWRAVRVHQHVLSRGDLRAEDRERAQYALAQDYLKAGLMDRAQTACLELRQSTAYGHQAELALLSVYERQRNWAEAHLVAQSLEASGEGSFAMRRAHYACEQAQEALTQHQTQAAQKAWDHAHQFCPGSARPFIEQAQFFLQNNQQTLAYESFEKLAQVAPMAIPLIAGPWVELANTTAQTALLKPLLEALYQKSPGLDLLEALLRLDADHRQRRERITQYLGLKDSLVAAAWWLREEPTQELAPIDHALESATRPLLQYRCAACGFEARRHFWQCPACQTWDSYPMHRVEEL